VIGYLGAFLGGLFTLISPCSALLLPAFFAYAFTGRAALLARTGIFYAGLVAVLVPLGMGSAAASRLVFGHQKALGLTSGLLLVGFGIVQLAGGGFSIAPGLRGRVRSDSLVSVLVLGAVSGLTGFCTGPILGAVLTIAAASGQALHGALLLAVYAAGMAAPLFVLAASWDRFDLRRLLRGKGFRIGPLRLHTTRLVSGGVFIALGCLFLVSGGTTLSGLPAVPATWTDRLTSLATDTHVPDLVLIAFAAAITIGITVRRLRTTRTPEADAEEESDDAAQR
jgi:cytochrome c biogenesis protein CcdA